MCKGSIINTRNSSFKIFSLFYRCDFINIGFSNWISLSLPRKIAAILIGSALGVTGSLVLGIAFFSAETGFAYLIFAFGGALAECVFRFFYFIDLRYFSALDGTTIFPIMSGSMIQTLARNRLATPDMLGIQEGAALFVTFSLLNGLTDIAGTWWTALLGAIFAIVALLICAGTSGRAFFAMGGFE